MLSVPGPNFKGMLKELLEKLDPGRLLPQAFEKCGLCPVDKNKVLERIPASRTTKEVATNIDAALLQRLEVKRFGDQKAKKRPRGQKIPAGQSYSHQEEEEESEVDSSEDESEDESKDESEEEEEIEASCAEELPDLDAGASGSGGTGTRARIRPRTGARTDNGTGTRYPVPAEQGSLCCCRVRGPVVSGCHQP